ncbi:hypothetical protein LEMLEM_LOCUS6687 [Lemmus lemmus]
MKIPLIGSCICLFKLQLMKCLEELKGLFITMRHAWSWKHQFISRRRWASKRLLMELVSHLGKKMILPGLMYKLDMKKPQRDDY